MYIVSDNGKEKNFYYIFNSIKKFLVVVLVVDTLPVVNYNCVAGLLGDVSVSNIASF